ncbi:Succinate-semialdehyde dehydrogenase NADP(+) GabD [Porphyridium purpureum]|uniref:Succinate-semialdehyde dehydrogenase NADP(+) GabD n=1 Tax=Porphyridium purpureum TaxID=35688 RepID=A0A5J4YYJ7_PORPP|nr:Succinate-semialdehyde dehydrogenase NADP(+) GabD [Porphyridium purpureum]|eukprot:POR2522..scf209_3
MIVGGHAWSRFVAVVRCQSTKTGLIPRIIRVCVRGKMQAPKNRGYVGAVESAMEYLSDIMLDSSLLHDSSFIDGRCVEPIDSLPLEHHAIQMPSRGDQGREGRTGTFLVMDPSTRTDEEAVLVELVDGGEMAAHYAVDVAARMFEQWRAVSVRNRASLLRKWSELIRNHAGDLARIICAETGKTVYDAYAEVQYAKSYVEWFAEEALRIQGDYSCDPEARVERVAVGVVGLMTPWNFPAAMVTRKVAAALAAGCTAVLKPSERTTCTALALADLAVRAGIAPGAFNVVVAKDPALVSRVLSTRKEVAKLSFTGSTAVGKMIIRQSALHVQRLSLELGGNAPLLIFSSADISETVSALVSNKVIRNCGQTCVSANRILVHDLLYDRFLAKLVQRIGELEPHNFWDNPGEDPCSPNPDASRFFGPLIHQEAVEKIELHIADALHHGAQLVCGGKRIPKIGLNFYEPTVVVGGQPCMKAFGEETFGPLFFIIRFANELDAIRLANDTVSGLAGYVFSQDSGQCSRVAQALDVGMVGINTTAISDCRMPFGGIKQSGYGREGSKYGLDEYLYLKYVRGSLSASSR